MFCPFESKWLKLTFCFSWSFPLSQHFQPMQSTQPLPLPKPHRPSACAAIFPSALPPHRTHDTFNHGIVSSPFSASSFFFLLPSPPAALVLAHLSSFISLSSPLCWANMHDYYHPSSFHPPFSVLSLLLLGHQNQSDSHRSCVLRLCLLPFPLFSLCLSLISHTDKYCV